MATEQKLLTAEDLLHMAGSVTRTELLDGVLVEMSPTGERHGVIVTRIARLLDVFVQANVRGQVMSGDPGVILRRNPDRVRAPDVCFTKRERLAGDEPAEGFTESVPDHSVVVISPDDRAGEIRQKTSEWLDAGAQLVWTVYPKTRQVVVSRPEGVERIYSADERLDGEAALPGFTVAVAELFAR
jgi:Uma2 family endonuclease